MHKFVDEHPLTPTFISFLSSKRDRADKLTHMDVYLLLNTQNKLDKLILLNCLYHNPCKPRDSNALKVNILQLRRGK